MSLPKWAEVKTDNDGIEKIFVNPSIAYPEILSHLGLEVDQYGIEIVFRCVVKLLKAINGEEVHIHIESAPNFALASLPPGLGLGQAYNDLGGAYARLQSLRLYD